MYDLPSEFLEEPGLPEVFHYLQPQLLSATFRLRDYAADAVFALGDLNIYDDAEHPLWHKRPDWFAAIGVPRLYDGWDLRLGYVMWQERVSPAVIVELISVGTEDEDLGRVPAVPDQPPPKWQVYEQILQVPYYVVCDRYRNALDVFTLADGRYQPATLENERCWLPDLNIGIGIWRGTYEGATRAWIRWFDASGEWILTPTEAAQQRADRLAARCAPLALIPTVFEFYPAVAGSVGFCGQR